MFKKCFYFLVAWVGVGILMSEPALANLFSKVFMPGKLSSGHAKYEDDCHNCHSSLKKSALQRRLCLDCHKKVAKDFNEKTGFHGGNKKIDRTECNHCHTEHKGRKFNIMLFDKDLFSHKITDFLLNGRHRKVDCVNCHPEKAKYREAVRLCYECHKKDDYHEGRLGKKCEECHDEKGWSHFRFDHNMTKYPLKGRHEKGSCIGCHPDKRYKGTTVVCYKCHKGDDVHGGGYSKECKECHTTFGWKKSTFSHKKLVSSGKPGISDCKSCHKGNDAHKGIFGLNCRMCHEESKWKPVVFDHSKTKFKLADKHLKVDCEACHITPISEKKTPVECFGCHLARDEHNGLFGDKCSTCHIVKGWEEPIFDHDKTKYKLIEKHLKVACPLCHKGNLYKDLPDSKCVTCHKFDDPHKSLYAAVCAPCHTTKGWDKPVFNHEKSVLVDVVEKTMKDCPSCYTHYTQRLGKECYGCHSSDDAHKGKEGRVCEVCHNTDGWDQKVFFEHDMTDFPLLGMHAVASCEGCHLDQAFKGLTTKCIDCHKKDDSHKERMGEKCMGCHNPNGWKYWIFDHSEKTKFPLDGVHEELECVACHKKQVTEDMSLPRACKHCHKGDSIHSGRYWEDCVRCHTAESFKDISIKKIN